MQKSQNLLFLWILTMGLLFVPGISADTYYIPDDYSSLQFAVNQVQSGDTIIVRDGTWTGSGFRDVETLSKAITIRSENGPDDCIIDCQDQGRAFYIHNSEGRDTVIDGFKIQNGVADGSGEDGNGGAIYIRYTSPTIKNCSFYSNSCSQDGGAINAHGSPRIQNCYFFANHSESFGGGAYVMSSGAGAEILGCTFYYNDALDNNFHGNGGGIRIGNGSGGIFISDCIFIDNSAERGAAAVIADSGQMYNCLFISNQTLGDHPPDQAGAGLYIYSDINIFNCTFNNNTTDGDGASIFVDGGSPFIRRCILWDDSSNGIFIDDGTISVTYSDVVYDSGTFPGTGNINSSPDFASGPDGNYYLSQIAAGQASNSPCLNAGDIQASSVCFTGISGQEICLDDYTTRTDEVNDSGTVDLGYHYPQPVATPTPTRTPTRTPTALPSQPTNTPWPTRTHTATSTPRPTYPPTHTPIPTRPPTETPTAPPGEPTYTPVPTNTPAPPTATPSCTTLGCAITMPSHDFGPGDDCWCMATICNPTQETYAEMPVFVILDVYGSYFFAPSFGEFDVYIMDIIPGIQEIQVLPSFAWPGDCGDASGIMWYAAMTNQEITQLFGDLGTFEFGWHS